MPSYFLLLSCLCLIQYYHGYISGANIQRTMHWKYMNGDSFYWREESLLNFEGCREKVGWGGSLTAPTLGGGCVRVRRMRVIMWEVSSCPAQTPHTASPAPHVPPPLLHLNIPHGLNLLRRHGLPYIMASGFLLCDTNSVCLWHWLYNSSAT